LYGKVLREEFAEMRLKHYNTCAGTQAAVDYTIWKSSDDNKREVKWDCPTSCTGTVSIET